MKKIKHHQNLKQLESLNMHVEYNSNTHIHFKGQNYLIWKEKNQRRFH